jgi:uncharacterized protein YxeA
MLNYFINTSFLLFITIHSVYAAGEFPEKIIFDQNDFYLKGKVKKVETWSTSSNMPPNTKINRKVLYFNDQGTLYRFDSEYGYPGGSWTFDSKTSQLKMHELYFLSKNGEKSNRQIGNVLAYDANGKPTSIGYIVYGQNDSIGYNYSKLLNKFEYSNSGHTMSSYSFFADGNLRLLSKVSTKYFSNTNLVQQEQLPNPFNNDLGIIRTYNKNGLDNILITTADRQIERKFIYDKDLLKKEITMDLKRKIIEGETEYSQYQLDLCGNWTKREIKTDQDNKIGIQHRMFEYYLPCTP